MKLQSRETQKQGQVFFGNTSQMRFLRFERWIVSTVSHVNYIAYKRATVQVGLFQRFCLWRRTPLL